MIITYLPTGPSVIGVNKGNISSLSYSDSDSISLVMSDRFHYEKLGFSGKVRLPENKVGWIFYKYDRISILSSGVDKSVEEKIKAILLQCDSDLKKSCFSEWPYSKIVQIYSCCVIRDAVFLGIKIEESEIRWAMSYQYRDGVVFRVDDDRFSNSISASFEDGIVLKTFDDESFFVGFDVGFKELWKIPIPSIGRLCSVGGNVALYFEDGGNWDAPVDVLVVSPRSGKEVWRRSFPQRFRNLWSREGLLYVACQGSGYVFDGETGEQLLALKDVCEAQVHREMLFGNGEYVFFVNYSYTLAREATSERTITVFNQKTGARILDIEIPEGWEYRESSVDAAVVYEDSKFYVPIQSNYSLGSAGGILVIDCDDLHSEIRFDSDVTFDTKMVPVGKEVECEVHVSWSNFDEIMRYAPPAMKAVGVSEGRSVLCGKEVKNKKFNGKVHLVIDASAVELGDWEREQLDMAVSCVTDRFSGLGFYASDGKTKMTAHWRVA